MKNDASCFVTLEKYKTDLSCFESKNKFIKEKIESFIRDYGFVVCQKYLSELEYLLSLLDTPAGMFISDSEWKKGR